MVSLTRPEGSEPQDFHLSRRGIASLFFAGFAVAAVSAEAEPIVTDAVGLIAGDEIIPHPETPLPAYVARPDAKGRYPVVIVVSEVFGVHEYIRDVCRRLAKLGYVAIAPAFFHRAGDPAPLKDFKAIQKIVESATNALVMSDIAATLAWAKQQPFAEKRFAITGFCWGGAVTWMAVAQFKEFKAGVAWYGRLSKPAAGQFLGDEDRKWPLDVVADLHAPVLGLYAGKDKGIPQTDTDAMKAALTQARKKGSDLVVYAVSQHGFHADYRDTYDPTAAADGWQRMLAHFAGNGMRPKTPPKAPKV
jgi:carboxymethylenebutenolidase